MRCSPFVAFGVLLLVRPAYGYIDPGVGSQVLVTLLGILFALAYTLKIYWRRVAGFFRYRFSRKRRDEQS
jgi:membrane protein CcdC involved in cytochrome C biogenesis